MKKFILFILITNCAFELNASVKCYIKIGFGDCVNCFNLLSIVDDFEKEYVFKEEYKGIETEILRQRFGVGGELIFHTSDSFYNSFGYDNFTVLSFYNDGACLLNCPLTELDKWSTSIKKLKYDIIKDELEVNLEGVWHDQCQVRLTDLKEIVILDPLLNRLNILDQNGISLHKFSVTNQFVEDVYRAKFGEKNSELNIFYKMREVVGSKSAAINFNTISLYKKLKYVLITGHYFIINNPDTILASFLSVVKFDENFDYKIINVNSEVKPEYFLGQSYFKILNDSNVLFDVISTNPLKPKFIIAENKIKNNATVFTRFYDDTIPYRLVDKRLNYRVTSFTQDNGYVAYFMFNKIYKNSKALPNLKLFDNYRFGMEFPNPKNYIAGLIKNDDLIYISYQIDTMNYVAFYNINAGKILPPVFSIPINKLSTFLQLDYPGLIYYVNKEKKLTKYKL